MKNTIIVLSLFFSCIAYSQTGTIKGQVTDKQSELPLSGATIELLNTSPPKGVIADFDGYFNLSNVPLGRHSIRISYIGYETNTIPNIEVTSGKDVVLSVSLIESFNQLNEIILTGNTNKDKAINKMASVSARQFGIEEVRRYAGGSNDVARLAANFAGVAAPDDSRNDIVVRGNSPTGLLWRVEGIPIPSPNHFSTMGTTGSPVSALNPNMLKNSDFITSAFPSEYGNALGGVFDLGFRKGNKDDYEFSFQMGAFSGLEATAEGPLNRKNNGSFLIAARYSLIGLIRGGAGTSATPIYSDVSFNVDLGKSKLGNFSLFGIIGNSNIDLLGKDASDDDLFATTDENAYVTSNVNVVGLKHKIQLSDNSYLKTIISGASNANSYLEDRILNLGTAQERIIRYTDIDNKESRLTFSTLFNTKINQKTTLRTGVLVENFSAKFTNKERYKMPDANNDGDPDLTTVIDIDGGHSLWQPFVQSQFRLSEKLTLNAGIHGMYSSLNEQLVVEPRAAINWKLNEKHAFNLGYGLHHQNIPLPLLYLSKDTNGTITQPNKNLDFVRSQHYVIGYDYKIAPNWRGKLEAYHQIIDKAGVESTATSYSTLNEGADFGFSSDKIDLVNKGTGTNTGVELTIEKFFSKGFHTLITTSIFESKYKGSDGIERDTPFNNNYVFNFLAGKEIKIGKAKRNIFSINTRFSTAGGKRYTPVDLEASKVAGYQVEYSNLAFSKQYDNYMRLDIKLGITLNSKKKKRSHQFYIDLLNVTNNDNVLISKYNRISNSVDNVNQRRFFPDFGYRFQF
ncbi:MAG: TonB-dependent receptor [Cellulophaga sp.]